MDLTSQTNPFPSIDAIITANLSKCYHIGDMELELTFLTVLHSDSFSLTLGTI